MMRYSIDTEFIEDGKTIDLVSIALVAEDGREYYAQSVEFDPGKADDWIWENVITYLFMHKTPFGEKSNIKSYLKSHLNYYIHLHKDGWCVTDDCPWRTRKQIKQEVAEFLDPAKFGKPDLCGWCSGSDWVVFYQLFGRMIDLPDGYPHYIKDLQYILDEQGISDDQLPPDNNKGQVHNALSDAKYIEALWRWSANLQKMGDIK